MGSCHSQKTEVVPESQGPIQTEDSVLLPLPDPIELRVFSDAGWVEPLRIETQPDTTIGQLLELLAPQLGIPQYLHHGWLAVEFGNVVMSIEDTITETGMVTDAEIQVTGVASVLAAIEEQKAQEREQAQVAKEISQREAQREAERDEQRASPLTSPLTSPLASPLASPLVSPRPLVNEAEEDRIEQLRLRHWEVIATRQQLLEQDHMTNEIENSSCNSTLCDPKRVSRNTEVLMNDIENEIQRVEAGGSLWGCGKCELPQLLLPVSTDEGLDALDNLMLEQLGLGDVDFRRAEPRRDRGEHGLQKVHRAAQGRRGG